MLRAASKLICFFSMSFFVVQTAQCKNVDLSEQIHLTHYIAGALRDLPSNKTRFNQALPNLGKKDQQIARQVMSAWTLNKLKFKIEERLTQLVISKDEQVLLTIETIEFSPLVILLNGSQRIDIDRQNVFGSLSRQLNFQVSGNSGSSANSLLDFLKPVFLGPNAYAEDSKYNTDTISPLGTAILMYSNSLAASSNLSQPPWETLGTEASGAGAAIQSFLHSDQFKFTCGKDQVTGHLLIAGKRLQFTRTKDGLFLDDSRYLISTTKPKQIQTSDVQLISAADHDIAFCKFAIRQIDNQQETISCNPDIDSICTGNLKLHDGCEMMNTLSMTKRDLIELRHNILTFGVYPKTLSSNPDLWEKDKKIKSVLLADLEVKTCENQACHATTLDTLLNKVFEQKGDQQDSKHVKKNAQIKAELYDKVALSGALLAGCKDESFKAEAQKHNLSVAPKQQKTGISR